MTAGRLVVIAGPSGVGKGSIVAGLCAQDPKCWRSVSMTTRPMRNGERDGVDYHFVTPEAFRAEEQSGGFLEAFEVFDHLYGTPRRAVDEHLASGDTVILEIDVQGALAIRDQRPDALLIFIAPPSAEVLRDRLLGRGDGMAPERLEARLDAAAGEQALADRFDALVINDQLDPTIAAVATLIARHHADAETVLES
ncbi:MAG: guanylate kinase [Acidimicrobiia bacterium]